MLQPAPKKYPDREEIMDRMILRFGKRIHLAVVPVVELCAEEAEKVMMEALLRKTIDSMKERIIYKDRVYVAADKPEFVGERVWCGKCKKSSIYKSYSFCPKCGSKILWIDKPEP